MCENSRQRVIHMSTAVAVIFFALQVACAVNAGVTMTIIILFSLSYQGMRALNQGMPIMG